MRSHSFDIVLAKELKHVQKSILLAHILFWIKKNIANEKNYIDGHFWTFNTLQSFHSIFDYMPKSSIDRWLNELCRDGWIVKSRHNKRNNDRTNWYALGWRYIDWCINERVSISQNGKWEYIDGKWGSNCKNSISQNGKSISQNGTALPDVIKDTKPNTNQLGRISELGDKEERTFLNTGHKSSRKDRANVGGVSNYENKQCDYDDIFNHIKNVLDKKVLKKSKTKIVDKTGMSVDDVVMSFVDFWISIERGIDGNDRGVETTFWKHIEHLEANKVVLPSKEAIEQAREKVNPHLAVAKLVIDYLNEKAGTKYRAVNGNVRLILAGLSNNYMLNDFKKVIDGRVKEWKGTDMEEYLRPNTLFGDKFDQYLNAPVYVEVKKKPVAYKKISFG